MEDDIKEVQATNNFQTIGSNRFNRHCVSSVMYFSSNAFKTVLVFFIALDDTVSG